MEKNSPPSLPHILTTHTHPPSRPPLRPPLYPHLPLLVRLEPRYRHAELEVLEFGGAVCGLAVAPEGAELVAEDWGAIRRDRDREKVMGWVGVRYVVEYGGEDEEVSARLHFKKSSKTVMQPGISSGVGCIFRRRSSSWRTMALKVSGGTDDDEEDEGVDVDGVLIFGEDEWMDESVWSVGWTGTGSWWHKTRTFERRV